MPVDTVTDTKSTTNYRSYYSVEGLTALFTSNNPAITEAATNNSNIFAMKAKLVNVNGTRKKNKYHLLPLFDVKNRKNGGIDGRYLIAAKFSQCNECKRWTT